MNLANRKVLRKNILYIMLKIIIWEGPRKKWGAWTRAFRDSLEWHQRSRHRWSIWLIYCRQFLRFRVRTKRLVKWGNPARKVGKYFLTRARLTWRNTALLWVELNKAPSPFPTIVQFHKTATKRTKIFLAACILLKSLQCIVAITKFGQV